MVLSVHIDDGLGSMVSTFFKWMLRGGPSSSLLLSTILSHRTVVRENYLAGHRYIRTGGFIYLLFMQNISITARQCRAYILRKRALGIRERIIIVIYSVKKGYILVSK
jgi:hypothetical protein